MLKDLMAVKSFEAEKNNKSSLTINVFSLSIIAVTSQYTSTRAHPY